jgi:hypothetical protein
MDYWRQLMAQGRLYRPRIDVFLNYWLTMKLIREVPSDRVFSDFREYVVAYQPDLADLLAEIARDADVYARMEKFPASSVEGRFHYRVIRALDTAAVGPFLLWVLRHNENELPAAQRHKALNAMESWLVRRALCRATAKDVNRTVLDLLRELDETGPADAGDTVETFLDGQRATSRYWPRDNELHDVLSIEPIYKNLTRPRLRMLLEAVEDSLRGTFGEGQPCPRNLTVEHVMPQGWRDHWAADVENEVAAFQRDRLVQTLGNLTLVSGKLNPAMSNRPWTDGEAVARGVGSDGKRSYLLEHSELKLNANLVARHEAAWTERTIRDRTSALIGQLIKIWPRPRGEEVAGPPTVTADRVEAPVEQPEDGSDDASVSSHVGKYRTLWRWLQDQDRDEIQLSFAQVEEILGLSLPPSARTHQPHWYGYEGSALGRAIRDAGWRASKVNMVDERVTFLRNAE